MKLNEGHFSFRTVAIDFVDKPYQEINSKRHLNIAGLSKWEKAPSDLHMHMVLFHFTCLCSLLQWNRKMPMIKVVEMFWYFVTNKKWIQIWICPMEKCLILEYFSRKESVVRSKTWPSFLFVLHLFFGITIEMVLN